MRGQIRAARALLRWRAEDLARESRVGVATIRRWELADAGTSLTGPNDMALRSALESGGVEFIDVGYAEEADIGDRRDYRWHL